LAATIALGSAFSGATWIGEGGALATAFFTARAAVFPSAGAALFPPAGAMIFPSAGAATFPSAGAAPKSTRAPTARFALLFAGGWARLLAVRLGRKSWLAVMTFPSGRFYGLAILDRIVRSLVPFRT
jgi:hypothetical protein